MLLALALAVQRSENMGTPTLLSPAMSALAQGRVKSMADFCDRIRTDLQLAIATEADSQGCRTLLAAALESVGFAERGM
jgi:hypothetical protein